MKRISNLFLLTLVSSLMASCAPPFETENSKLISGSLNASTEEKEIETTTFEVQPTVPPAAIRRLPPAEQQVGVGANRVQLGVLEITESRIFRLEDGQMLKFTGKGKLRDKTFDIDISGRADAEGKVRMFPQDTSSTRTSLAIRGMGVCLDLIAQKFKCRSLFLDVYVRLGNETFSEQFYLLEPRDNQVPSQARPTAPQQTAQQPPNQLTPETPRATGAPAPAQTPERIAETEQERPSDLSPELLAANDDIEFEGEETPPENLTEENNQPMNGRFVGFLDEVDQLFQSTGPTSPTAPDQSAPAAAPVQTPRVDPPATPPPADLVTANVETVTGPAAGNNGFVLGFPRPNQPATAQVTASPKPVVAPQVADQARGCYTRGLPGCRSGGTLHKANRLALEGVGFKVLYPQRQMYYGTQILADLLVDMGKKLNEILPGYKIPVSDMSSNFGGSFGVRRDGGHQNGLEADLGYITTTSPPPLVVVVNGNNFRREIVKMDEQLQIWRHIVASNQVAQIFVDQKIKNAFCSYSNRMPRDANLIETLRRLRHWVGHRNHWHLRLKCPPSSPRCQDSFPVPEGSGC
ncbi:MAG: penicillin-insensitive murein endopeptidase [Pseudobdellovibrionaceae bacterium]